MKIRDGFISNSSSTSFIITNKTDKTLTLVDFVEETISLVDEFKKEYDWHKDDPKFTKEQMRNEARKRWLKLLLKIPSGLYNDNEVLFPPGKKEFVFGDEDGDVIGIIFDYMLREGGESKSFKWRFNEWRR